MTPIPPKPRAMEIYFERTGCWRTGVTIVMIARVTREK
jgi:hypothetical protein